MKNGFRNDDFTAVNSITTQTLYVDQSQIDNIGIVGNTISSLDINGDINITPDGSGNLVLDSLKWPQTDGTAGYVLKTDGAGQLSWISVSGTGDVTGPASATDNAAVRFNLTTGKLIQNSGVIIDDGNNVTGIVSLTATTANATTFDTNVAAAGVTLVGTTLSADGTDANIDVNVTPKGTGSVNISKANIDAGTIDGVTIGTSSACTELQVDNINVNGNSITSTNLNGSINITPNGTGDIVLDSLKWPQADGSANYVLKTNGSGQLSWVAQTTGDVVGPASATDNAIARYDLTTGKLIQNSGVIISDTNDVTGIGSLTATTVVSNTLKTTSGTMALDSFSTGIIYNKNNGTTYFQTRDNVDITAGGQISTVNVTLTGTAWTVVGPFITGSALVIVTSAMNGALNMVAAIVENTIGGAGTVNYPVRTGGNLSLQISAGNLELKKPIAGFDGIYTVYVFGGNQLYP